MPRYLSLIAILLCVLSGLAAGAALASTPRHRTTPAASRSRHGRLACRSVSKRHRHRKHHRHCTQTKPLRAKGANRVRVGAARPATPNATSTATTIAGVLDAPCQNTELMPEAANLALVEEATLCLVNQERARNNQLPLQVNAQLTQVAQRHSEDMIGSDYFSHTSPNGETQLERVLASGYIPNSQVGYTVGENIAWATFYLATPSSIVAAWIASPEHLANILTGAYRDSGIGVDPAAPASLGDAQPGAIYTQEFGVIQD